jgi:UDP-N-acetylglucosamine:LPS N-acetylglucosamine transferase
MSGTVMITTGGTGGHVFPGLAVASKLISRGWRVFWLGTRHGMEAKLVPQHGVDFVGVSFAGIRGKGVKQLVFGPLALLRASLQSLKIIRRRSPDVVLGFGGFASFPGALMGVACGKPLVIHDSNAVAGLANRVLAYGPTASCWDFLTRCTDSMRRRSSGWAIRCAMPLPMFRHRSNASPDARALCACWSSAAASVRKR